MKKKYERKYLAHYIDTSFNATSPSYDRLGKDLEEYSIELNPDGESKKNILGESSYNLKGYEPSGDVETYYAYEDEPLFTQLAKIANGRLTGAECETTVVDVLVDSSGEVVWAYRENVVVVPQSIGGEDGVQIPFQIYYNGNRTEGTWDVNTKAFTPKGSE